MDYDDLMEKVEYLVRINPETVHPPLSQVGQPKLKPSYKPLSKEKARQDLLKLRPEEIENRYNEEISRQREQSEREEKKRFFNQSYCDADFDYFGKKALWSLDEGISLILGKDPRKVKWDDIKMYLHLSPFVKKFEEIRELALGYKNTGQLSDPMNPTAFLVWAERMKYEIPHKLQEVAGVLESQVTNLQILCIQAIDIMNEKDKVIEALQDEINQLKIDMEKISKENLSSRSEDTYLTIIGVILNTMFSITPGGQKISCFENQSALIEYLVENFSSFRGISKSTLEDKFSKANKTMSL